MLQKMTTGSYSDISTMTETRTTQETSLWFDISTQTSITTTQETSVWFDISTQTGITTQESISSTSESISNNDVSILTLQCVYMWYYSLLGNWTHVYRSLGIRHPVTKYV